MPYKVIQCPNCGMNQVTSAQVLKCKFCGKSRKLVSAKGELSVNIFATLATAQEAAQYVRELNRKKQK
jgi:transcription elongation factor Elf1